MCVRKGGLQGSSGAVLPCQSRSDTCLSTPDGAYGVAAHEHASAARGARCRPNLVRCARMASGRRPLRSVSRIGSGRSAPTMRISRLLAGLGFRRLAGARSGGPRRGGRFGIARSSGAPRGDRVADQESARRRRSGLDQVPRTRVSTLVRCARGRPRRHHDAVDRPFPRRQVSCRAQRRVAPCESGHTVRPCPGACRRNVSANVALPRRSVTGWLMTGRP